MRVTITSNDVNTLSHLAFCEEVDRLVEKGHLFKRSIMLLKAWAMQANIMDNLHFPEESLETLFVFVFNAFYQDILTVIINFD